jgi:hypothetical protein
MYTKVSVGNPEEKRTLLRPRHGWDDNIKLDVTEISGGRVFSDAVNRAMTLWVQKKKVMFWLADQ